MFNLLWSLSYLCIETISKNIYRYCRTAKINWKMCYSNGLGDRLILACISNSFLDDFDEKSYEFILKNFHTEKLHIFPKLFERIKYFDFLNEKYFTELKIDLRNSMILKDKQQFRLKVHKLRLNFSAKDKFFAQSKDFFSNLKVENNIFIHLRGESNEINEEIEILLLQLLENTSKEIEQIQIVSYLNPTDYFIKKYLKILLERKCLKNLTINFQNNDILERKCTILYESTLKLIVPFKINYQNYEYDFPEYLKNLDSLNSLKIIFLDKKDSEYKQREYLAFIKSLNLISLNSLKLYNFAFKNDIKESFEFFKNLPNLESLTLDFIPCFCVNLKNLKSLHLLLYDDTYLPTPNFEKFLNKTSLKELEINFDCIDESSFLRITNYLQVLENSLLSISFAWQGLHENCLTYFSTFVKKFTKLTDFFLMADEMEEIFMLEILNSLNASRKTLREIYFCAFNNFRTEIYKSKEFFQILNGFDGLTALSFAVKLQNVDLTESLSVLEKFQKILEVFIMDFCCENLDELLDFLSNCSCLKRICGIELTESDGIDKIFLNSKYSLVSINDTHYKYVALRQYPLIFMQIE